MDLGKAQNGSALMGKGRKDGEIEMTRQEAIETISIAIARVEWEYPIDYAAAFDMAVKALSLPEIVRCKDCEHGEKVQTFKYYSDITWCNKHSTSHNDDWYCADGEKVVKKNENHTSLETE